MSLYRVYICDSVDYEVKTEENGSEHLAGHLGSRSSHLTAHRYLKLIVVIQADVLAAHQH